MNPMLLSKFFTVSVLSCPLPSTLSFSTITGSTHISELWIDVGLSHRELGVQKGQLCQHVQPWRSLVHVDSRHLTTNQLLSTRRAHTQVQADLWLHFWTLISRKGFIFFSVLMSSYLHTQVGGKGLILSGPMSAHLHIGWRKGGNSFRADVITLTHQLDEMGWFFQCWCQHTYTQVGGKGLILSLVLMSSSSDTGWRKRVNSFRADVIILTHRLVEKG